MYAPGASLASLRIDTVAGAVILVHDNRARRERGVEMMNNTHTKNQRFDFRLPILAQSGCGVSPKTRTFDDRSAENYEAHASRKEGCGVSLPSQEISGPM